MKKVMLGTGLMLLSCFSASAQVKMPQPSPLQTLKQDFGLGSIELVYSRPAAKNRQIFGDLVPFGKLWRTGANATTRITFTTPVEIGGKSIDTGSYAIYTIPGKEHWEVIINKGYKNPSITAYKESEDVVRVKAKAHSTSDRVESFTMQIDHVLPESATLVMSWENTVVVVPIKTQVTEKLKESMKAALSADGKKPYWQAAQFYNEYDNNPKMALEMVTHALEENPNAFWMWLFKARIQEKLGDKSGAIASAEQSLKLATEQGNDDYIKMNKEFISRLK